MRSSGPGAVVALAMCASLAGCSATGPDSGLGSKMGGPVDKLVASSPASTTDPAMRARASRRLGETEVEAGEGEHDVSAVAIIPVEGAPLNIPLKNEDLDQLAAARVLGLALVDARRETELRHTLQQAAVRQFVRAGTCSRVRVRLDMDFTYAGTGVEALAAPAWVLPAALQGCGRIEQVLLAVHVPEEGDITARAIDGTPLPARSGAQLN